MSVNSRNMLKAELIAGRSWFDWTFLLLGIVVQIVVYTIQPDSPVAIVSGIAGIISVILCAQGKISTFLFGFVQIGTYLYLSFVERLYGEVAINIFYFCSQIYAIVVWHRRYHLTDTQSAELRARRLSLKQIAWLAPLCVALSLLLGFVLSRFTNDTQPWLDAFTTVPALFAQVLLMLAYREQWAMWLLVDVLSVLMWINASNWCLVAQYVFWCTNCLYGWIKWSGSNTSASGDIL